MERDILGLMGAMNIKSEEGEDYVILRLKGEIDIYNAKNLEEIINAFVTMAAHKARNVILDFKNVNYMDSSGIATLIKCGGLTEEGNFDKNLILINLNDKINELFKLARIEGVFNILNSEQEAKSFKAK